MINDEPHLTYGEDTNNKIFLPANFVVRCHEIRFLQGMRHYNYLFESSYIILEGSMLSLSWKKRE